MIDQPIGAVVPSKSPRVGTPGVLLIGLGVVAFMLSVISFSIGWIGCGTWAGILALLSSAAGLAWLSDEGRRQRGNRPLLPRKRAGSPPPTGGT